MTGGCLAGMDDASPVCAFAQVLNKLVEFCPALRLPRIAASAFAGALEQ
jgi:hypothetical protein